MCVQMKSLVKPLLRGWMQYYNVFFVLLVNRVKPSDFDYLKVIGRGSFGKVGF